MHIYLASDHRGHALRSAVFQELLRLNYEVTIAGPLDINPEDDYPDIATMLIDTMNHDVGARGIVICGSGVGVSIAANRYPHIRCALGFSVGQIEAARNDDDCNVLALAADFVSQETALSIVQTFLATPFRGEERHKRRIEKLSHL